MRAAPQLPIMVAETPGVTESAMGGGLEGAERTSRETALWNPHMGSPDRIVNSVKSMADARGRDMNNNDGYTRGAVTINKDSIVGAHYRLNAKPVWKVLASITGKSFDETWATEFQEMVEARFDLIAESDDCWLDASGTNTFTELIRLGVGGAVLGGEIIAAAEWLKDDPRRPLKTAVQMVSAARMSNPNGQADDEFLRRGVAINARGKPQGYWFREAHPGDYYASVKSWQWRYIPARKPWGRRQIIHIYEQQEPGQSRGIADIVSVLKNMRMTKHFDELTLQQAVINASYAAAIETEMPPDAVYSAMGGNSGSENFTAAMGSYMGMLSAYFGAANNVTIDGVKIPVLPPGTSMKTQALGTPGGMGGDYGKSLLRHTCAALGISFEEFSRDFSGISYSGLKGAFASTDKTMKAKKKGTADRLANGIYSLVLEEEIANGNVPLPRGVSRQAFYLPLAKEAFCKATWVGAGKGQIDELKETQAAILRIASGLSTYEIEVSRLGYDFRDIYAQQVRERKAREVGQLVFDLSSNKPSSGGAAEDPKANNDNGQNNQEDDEL